MKTIIDDDTIIVFLDKSSAALIDFKNKEALEKYFRKLFNRIIKKHDIMLMGYYDIDVYIDKIYGVVLEMQKDAIDYPEYFKDDIDMCITVKEKEFLYEIEDYFDIKDILKDIDVYKYKNKLYVKLNDNIDTYTFGRILEFSQIVYNDLVNVVLQCGKKINII